MKKKYTANKIREMFTVLNKKIILETENSQTSNTIDLPLRRMMWNNFLDVLIREESISIEFSNRIVPSKWLENNKKRS